ncbi:endospore germination permease [Clostridium paridis]|uniref:Endospore germination permease n=1 Tax=Clostridium paridis TaxID=2803863 RepID=A0A937FK55_9CLOT|nr:endospore germination permease [Clostridium paridis]MBL4934082.1 endospore germination permease [Clostridium paridis]
MDKFSPRHFLFLILGVSIVSLKTYPSTYVKNGARDSWIAIIISSIIIFFYFLYVIGVWRKNNSYNIKEIYQTALGKYLGNAFFILFLLTLLLTLIECASVESDSMHENMLLETPNWFLILFFTIPLLYTINKDIVAIVTVTIIGIVLISLAGINLGMLTSKYKHISYLFPILEHGINGGFIICILKTLGLYGTVSIALPYISKITDSKNKIIKYVIIALLILIQMQIISVSGIIMTFGPTRVMSMNYTKLLQTQLISYFQFLEFGELYVIFQIIDGWLLKYIITFYALLSILKLYNLKEKHTKYASYILTIFIIAGAYFTTKNSLILFKLLNYYEYICLINFVLNPFITFFLFNWRIKKNQLISKY